MFDDIFGKEQGEGSVTCLSEGFVVEACLTDLECMPFFFDYFLVDVDNIEVFVLRERLMEFQIPIDHLYHPKFMSIITN